MYPPRFYTRAQEFAKFYQTCYNMCTQRSPYNWSEQLYQRHGETFNSYLTETVLPAMKEKHDEHLLKELVRRWFNHKIMNKWMKKFFLYLDRYYVRHHSLPTLQDAGLRHFKQLVFDQIKRDAVNALLAEVNKEREGEEIDRALMRQCVEVFEHMGMATLDTYIQDLERPLLTETKNYYTRKSQAWLETDSTPAYMKKAEKALADEATRVGNYLISVTSARLTSVCVNASFASGSHSNVNSSACVAPGSSSNCWPIHLLA